MSMETGQLFFPTEEPASFDMRHLGRAEGDLENIEQSWNWCPSLTSCNCKRTMDSENPAPFGNTVLMGEKEKMS